MNHLCAPDGLPLIADDVGLRTTPHPLHGAQIGGMLLHRQRTERGQIIRAASVFVVKGILAPTFDFPR